MFGAARPGGEISSTTAARDYLDSILIETRFLDSDLPELKTTHFGERFSTPIATGALSHLPSYGEGRPLGLLEIARVAGERGMANFVGITDDELFARIAPLARTVRIVKPFADRRQTVDAFAFARSHGALAVGVDIDMVYDKSGGYKSMHGAPLRPVRTEELREWIAGAGLPFVVKGVLSAADALAAARAGAAGIVVSSHGGYTPWAQPPALALPGIRAALGKDSGVTVLIDGRIDRGADAFKALALGADAVCSGSAMIPLLKEKGPEGLREQYEAMDGELAMLLASTGARSPGEADPACLILP